MRFRWLVTIFALATLVGGGWDFYRSRARPVRMSVQELLYSDAFGKSGRAVALIGTVPPSSRRDKGRTEWWFTLEENGRAVPVHYSGPVPSTFCLDGARVLVIGRMRDGTFNAKDLLVRSQM